MPVPPEAELTHKDLGLFPIEVHGCGFLDRWFGWDGITLLLVILYNDAKPCRSTMRHERIHYVQGREMLLLPFAAAYLLHIVVGVVVYMVRDGKSASEALEAEYAVNPFEEEARYGEERRGYLGRRRWGAWWGFRRGFPASV